jgi:ankyrin repeat protein
MRFKFSAAAYLVAGLVLGFALLLCGCPRPQVSVQEDLIEAAADGNVRALRKALKEGADPNGTTASFADTPLFMAVANDQPEAVQVLLDAGANPNKSGARGAPRTVVRSGIVRKILEGEARWSGEIGGP